MLVHADCTSSELRDDGIHIVDAASPNAAAGLNERRPKPRVVRERGMRCEICSRGTRGESAASLFSGERLVSFTDEIDCAVQSAAINHDFDHVSLVNATNRTTGERLR
jgi:hypothetical protein